MSYRNLTIPVTTYFSTAERREQLRCAQSTGATPLNHDAAAQEVVMKVLPAIGGRGGLIAVDALGNLSLPFNTKGMYRGHARVGAAPTTAIFR
jgi:isoaspartyl peptidase/L-asparaginase-like protein (Ntn-hydrolase superfamily)